jgi:phytoene/squalene synthetase
VSLEACAGLVERGDPDRFLAVMAAPPEARVRLFPLYAFNLEVARAPWVTEEPMIAEMRLQWWRDTVDGLAGSRTVRAHEVAAPLARVVREQGLDTGVMDRLIEARRWDITRDPFADQAAMDRYLEDTGAGLMWLACQALGAGPSVEAVARDAGWASGLAGFLRAVRALEARGRVPLVDGRAEAVAGLARRGLARLAQARAGRGIVPAGVRPALLAGWQTSALLGQVVSEPGRVSEGRMGLSEFGRKGRLLWASLTGTW